MKVTNFDRPIRASWMDINGRRLVGNYYLSGALEARMILEQLEAKKQPLQELTLGGITGIFNGPRFPRHYVDNPDYGVPFLSSTDILAADLSNLSLLSNKQVETKPELLIDEGWTLISCSGTIGRMAYARSDMKGMAGSQHFMRVVPDSQKIKPGYLHAFLSSKFGVPLVVEGTYGAIIQHIEPYHIAELPIPRLNTAIESKAHELIISAAKNRTEALKLISCTNQAIIDYFQITPPRPLRLYERPSITIVSAENLESRMYGYYFAEWNTDAAIEINSLPRDQVAFLKDIVEEIYIPHIFKRSYVDDPHYGYPYLTGSDVYQLAPTSDRYLEKNLAENMRLVLHEGMILIQDSGQLGGLIGHPVAVSEYLDGFACTNNMVRIVPKTKADQGYLFAVLSTDYGYRLITREASGSSIPHLYERDLFDIPVPWPSEKTRKKLGKDVLKAIRLRDEACELEMQARILVEKTIEQGAV